MPNRLTEARLVARALLDDLESSGEKIEKILMRAQRLARLMRDADAQNWLGLETRGYPDGFSFTALGTCQKYAAAGGRIDLTTSKYNPQSLVVLEANLDSAKIAVEAIRAASAPPTKVKDYLEKGATEALMATQLKLQHSQQKHYADMASRVASLRAAVHNYATDTYLAIELGDAAETIFEAARNEVDSFVRSHCPKAAEKLVAINERMSEGSPESNTAALTSCRRLLLDVADSVFPARTEDWKDSAGKLRKVSHENYKNRLLAYMAGANQSNSSSEVVDSQLEHLAARLDAIYEKTCKGVHIDVSDQEARLAVIHTYLFLGEIARQHSSG